jgi:hypothetical protein
MPEDNQIVDAKGTHLVFGDAVVSTKSFDAGHAHRGVIELISYATGRIWVRHVDGCCEENLTSEDCLPSLWVKSRTLPGDPKPKSQDPRPTAWERLMR